ncbi:MAG TPA: cytochrome b N-terminal domain-containing protein [Blastocatellia bacterium]|nr:cytochrome b N-terminal domain-containing protein [Blastocatellia bacterium]
MASRLYDWLDERTGLRKITHITLYESVPGGSRWAYVMGSGLVFLFLLQGITGVFLCMYYVPSADHAHASVSYIQKVVPGGALIRSLHHYGANALIILLVVHFAQVFIFGSYKHKRELLWIAGGLLAVLAAGFAFTGYLLPWDQESYFGTKVGTSIAGEIPLIGSIQQRIMLGGSEITALTLSRFFMTHVFLLPLGFTLLIVIHIYLFRRAGAAGSYKAEPRSRSQYFYPDQLLKDAIFILVLFAGLVWLCQRWPAELGPQADPTSEFLARPPWYFLPLFELLKYFPGKLSLIPTAIIPAAVFALILAVPFIDTRPERHPLRRPIATAALAMGLIGVVGLVVAAKLQDRANPDYRAKLEEQDTEAKMFLKAAFQPQENGRSIAVTPPEATSPTEAGSDPLKIFLANCASCHGSNASGGPLGPSLIKIARRRGRSVDFLERFIAGHGREPSSDSMPRFGQLTQDDVAKLAEWLVQLNAPIQTPSPTPSVSSDGPAPQAFTDNCSICHGDHGEGAVGPSLIGVTARPRRSDGDLMSIMNNSRAYGLKDPMPASFPAISDADKQAIVEWLHKLNGSQ